MGYYSKVVAHNQLQCSIQPKSKIDSMFFCLLKTREHIPYHAFRITVTARWSFFFFSFFLSFFFNTLLSTETSQTTLSTQNTEVFTHVRVYNGNLPDCRSCSVYVDMYNRKQLNNRIDSYLA